MLTPGKGVLLISSCLWICMLAMVLHELWCLKALAELLRPWPTVQSEAIITHPSLPRLKLKRCMVGRLTVRCQSLDTLHMDTSTMANLHIQCPQLRYSYACCPNNPQSQSCPCP